MPFPKCREVAKDFYLNRLNRAVLFPRIFPEYRSKVSVARPIYVHTKPCLFASFVTTSKVYICYEPNATMPAEDTMLRQAAPAEVLSDEDLESENGMEVCARRYN